MSPSGSDQLRYLRSFVVAKIGTSDEVVSSPMQPRTRRNMTTECALYYFSATSTVSSLTYPPMHHFEDLIFLVLDGPVTNLSLLKIKCLIGLLY